MIRLGTGGAFGLDQNYDKNEFYRLLAEAGYASCDFYLMIPSEDPYWKRPDDQLKEQMLAERAVMDANGIIPGQAHGPIISSDPNDPSTKEPRWNSVIQAIKACSYLGCPYLVVHPIMLPQRLHKEGVEETKALNMEFFNYLRPALKEYGVKCAIENIYWYDHDLGRTCETTCSSPEELIDYLDTLNADGNELYVACFDIGHCVLAYQDPIRMIHALGYKYLHCTHIHDNNYINDNHLAIGMGKINWPEVGRAFREIGFDKVFNFEDGTTYHFFRGKINQRQLALDMLRLSSAMGNAIVNCQ